MARKSPQADMSLLSNPEIRACLPIESIPWGLMTFQEKQKYFEKCGSGYVRIRSNSEIEAGAF